MGQMSLTHILLVGFVLLIFFGPSRLPALGQALGKSIHNFKKGLSESTDEGRYPEQLGSESQSQGHLEQRK